jgi:hypothetical protein
MTRLVRIFRALQRPLTDEDRAALRALADCTGEMLSADDFVWHAGDGVITGKHRRHRVNTRVDQECWRGVRLMRRKGCNSRMAQKGREVDRRRIPSQFVRGAVAAAVGTCLVTVVACSRSDGTGISARVIGERDIRVIGERDIRVISGKEVRLLPRLGAGEGGWCLTDSPESPGVCGEGRAFRGPVRAESWSSYGSSAQVPVREGIAVTESSVTAVSIEGSPAIPTRAELALPNNSRAVAVEMRGGSVRDQHGFRVPAYASRFVPLDSRGVPVPQPGEQHIHQLTYRVPIRRWAPPQSAGSGVCQIVVERAGKFVAQGGAVASRVVAENGLVGRPFFSCASTSYHVGPSAVLASVLLDASRPGTTPASLPAMRPISGHPGFFQAPGVEGGIVARRIPDAWIVVSRGSLQQRLSLLERLDATVRL